MKMRLTLPEAEDDIDLTPLIDCVFLLVLFFMVTASFIEESKAFKIELPTAEKAQTIPQKDILAVSVTVDGSYWLREPGAEPRKIDNLEVMLKLLQQSRGRGEKMPVIIRCDARAQYQHFVQVVNVLKEAGVENFFQEVETEHDRKKP